MRKSVRNSKIAVLAFVGAIVIISYVLYLLLFPVKVPVAFYFDATSGMNPVSSYRQSLVIAMDYFNSRNEGWRRHRFVPVFLSSSQRNEVLKKAVAAGAQAVILAADPTVTQVFLDEAASLDMPIINIAYRALRLKNQGLFHVKGPDTEKNLGEWAREFGLGDYIEITLLRDPLFPDDLESWFSEGIQKAPRRRLVYINKDSVPAILGRLADEMGLDGVYVNIPPYDAAVLIQLIHRNFPDLKIFASSSIMNSHASKLMGEASRFTNTITSLSLNLLENQDDAESEHPFLGYLSRNGYTRVLNANAIQVGYNAISLLHEALHGQEADQTLRQALVSLDELPSLSGYLHKNHAGDWMDGYYRVHYGTD